MKEHDIEFNGVPMTVKGVYYEDFKGALYEPHEPHDFNCMGVNIEGVDIMQLLADDVITEIEKQVLIENY